VSFCAVPRRNEAARNADIAAKSSVPAKQTILESPMTRKESSMSLENELTYDLRYYLKLYWDNE
jgi:hypothetical protein